MKKIALGKQNISHISHALCCPKCQGSLFLNTETSLVCHNRHCYDLSAKGYVNFLANPHKELYTKETFLERRHVFESGFFDGIVAAVVLLLKQRHVAPNAVVLDVGCGEGSFLKKLNHGTSIGCDISKQSIALATDFLDGGTVWLVADSAALPIATNSIDVLINLFAPANYSEFERVLKPNGLLIKLSPGDQYLQEIRTFFYTDTKTRYSGDTVTDHFFNKYPSAIKKEISYTVPVNNQTLKQIINMTPLAWHFKTDQVAAFMALDLPQITVNINMTIHTIAN